jgi:arginyl-tRNA synthetase
MPIVPVIEQVSISFESAFFPLIWHVTSSFIRAIFPETSDLSAANLALLNDPCELEMIKILSNWPRQVEVSAVNREPHRITNYLYDVASAFHALWNKGMDNSQLRFIEPDNLETTMARQALIKGVLIVLANGLHLFGITPVQEMR